MSFFYAIIYTYFQFIANSMCAQAQRIFAEMKPFAKTLPVVDLFTPLALIIAGNQQTICFRQFGEACAQTAFSFLRLLFGKHVFILE